MAEANRIYGQKIPRISPEGYSKERIESFVQLITQFEYVPEYIKPYRKLILDENVDFIKFVVTCIKDLIRYSDDYEPWAQFNSLRVLKLLIETFSIEFQVKVEQSLLALLKEVALKIKQSGYEDGRLYFIKENAVQNQELRYLGVQYNQLLLECLQMWSIWFKNSEYEVVYNDLKLLGIKFPQNYIYFSPTQAKMTQEQVLKEIQSVKQKYDPQPKETEKKDKVDKEKADKGDKGEKDEKTDDKQDKKEKDKDKDKEKEKEKEIEKEKELEKAILTVTIADEKKTSMHKIYDFLNKYYSENKLSYYSIRSLFGRIDLDFYAYHQLASLTSQNDYYKKYQFTISTLKCVELGFTEKPYAFVNYCYRIFIFSYLLNTINIDYYNLFLDYLMKALINLVEYQQKYYKKMRSQGKVVSACYNTDQSFSSTYYVELITVLNKFNKLYKDNKYFNDLENLIQGLKYNNQLFMLNEQPNEIDILRKQYQDRLDMNNNEIQSKLQHPTSMLNVKDAFKLNKMIYTYRRKMQILQNKVVAFQYFTKEKPSCFYTKNFQLSSEKKHIVYIQVDDLNEVFKVLQEQEKLNYPLQDKELRFFLSKVQIKYDQKYENKEIYLSRISFKNCSTLLINRFIMLNVTSSDRVPKSLEIINCAINDYELKDLLKHLENLINQNRQTDLYPKYNMKLRVEGCRNLSYSFLEIFNHQVEKWNQLQEKYQTSKEEYRNLVRSTNLNLIIKNSTNFKGEDFLKLSTYESIRGTRGIKLKKLDGENIDKAMSYILQARLIYTKEEVYYRSMQYATNLKGLSFDSSVCNNFEELTLNEEYFSKFLRKLSFKCVSQIKQSISFSKMTIHSLTELKVLKLKNCILTSDFFKNLSKLSFVEDLTEINFQNSQFDSNDFNTFIQTTNLKQICKLNLSYTSIDDNTCYTIYNFYSNKYVLQSLDISNNQTKKLTHKGIKYLTYINSLQNLNISNCQHAVEDTLSIYLVDFIGRKNKQLKENYIKLIDSYLLSLAQFLSNKYKSQTENIEQCSKLEAEALQILEEIKQLKQASLQKINQKDYEDYFNPNDTNIYLHITEFRVQHFLKEIQDGINLMKKKEKDVLEEYKPIHDKIKEMQDLKIYFNPKYGIDAIDLSGNKNITSVFFDQFYTFDYLEKIFYLNLSKTSVCGEIFKYINLFDDCQDYKGQTVQKNVNIYKKGTLEQEEIEKNEKQEGKGNDSLQNMDESMEENEEEDEEDEEDKKSKDKVNEKLEINLNEQAEQNKSGQNSPRQKNQVKAEEEPQKQEEKNQLQPPDEQIKSMQNASQYFESVNQCLEVLILSQCQNIKPKKFKHLFNTVFHSLQELNLNDCNYFDQEFEDFIKNKSSCFSLLKVINLQHSNITNETMWKLFTEDKSLCEIYVDFSNFSLNPYFSKQIELTNQLPSMQNLKGKNSKQKQIKTAKAKLDENRILPCLFIFSAVGCKIWEDNHLLEILEQIKSQIFDFNYFLGCYRHLITKKLIYYLIQEYSLLKRYFYLNINGAALPDIDESEKYQEETQQFYNIFLNGFQKKKVVKNKIQQSNLETIILDNTRINYKLFSKIIKYHPSIVYISCQNTPCLQPTSIVHKKSINSEDQLNIAQLMHLVNQKNMSLSERNITEVLSQIRKIKEEERKVGEKPRKIRKLILNGNQLLSSQTIDKLIFELFPYLNSLHLQYTKVESNTILQVIEKGSSIEYIGLKGCIHLSKEILISICKCKNLSKNFRLECVLEMKHLIDYEVLIALSQSRYMSNILYLDLSDIKLPNMDDCIMSICFVAQDISINLRIINVQNTLISDRGFQMISVSQKFRNLERIYFKDCPLITERGVSFIVDSNNLTRFDLGHFLYQNSGLLNGRIIDTLKYSNRKIFFREINFQESTISDKELQKLLNETLTNEFAVKMFDFRFTPNLTSEGIRSVYNIYQRTVRKQQQGGQAKNEDEEIRHSQLEIIFLDNRRNKSLFIDLPKYEEIFNKMLDIQQLNRDQNTIQQQQQISTPQNNTQAKGQDKNKDQKANNNQQQNNKTVQQSSKKNNQISQTYEESEIAQWKEYIIRDDPYVSFTFEEEFKKDNVLVDIFLYAENLYYFKYDYFISIHKEMIDNNMLMAFSLIRYFAQKKMFSKNIIEQTNQNNKAQDEAEVNAYKQSINYLLGSFVKFQYLDLSDNNQLSEQSLCIFFLNSQILINVKTVNLSRTQVTEKVIDVILASKFFSVLQFIQLDECQNLKDINYVLNKVLDKQEKKTDCQFDIRKFFFYYLVQINDETLARYLKYFIDKKIKVECINLDSSNVNGLFFKYQGCFQKIRVLNISNTYFQFQYLNPIATQKNCIKTIWVDRTYSMTDKVCKQLITSGEFTLFTDITKPQNHARKLRIEEFLYSKGPELNISLNSFLKTSILYFKQKNLNLNYFPQIDPILLADILSSGYIRHFRQICLDFTLNCQIPAFKKFLNLIYTACKNSELFCFKTNKINVKYQLDIQYFLQAIGIISDNLIGLEKQKEYLDRYSYVFDKALVDPSITTNFPFILQEELGQVEKYYRYIQNQQLELEGGEQIVKPIPKIQNTYYIFLFQSFQFTELDLSSTLIERKSLRILLQHLRNGNNLLKLNLNNQKLIYDQDIIKYLIKKNELNQRSFKYLEILKVVGTNVTQRSLCKILQECPFSSSFNISELMSCYIQNYINNKYNAINNQLVEYLINSHYLLNIKNLDLKEIPITDNILQQLFYSKYAVNIEKIQVNYEFISNSTFVSLASTKKLPLLKSYYIDNDAINCKTHLHYLFRAKNLHLDLDMSQIIFDNNFMFQQQNYVMSMIESIYMLKQKNLVMKSIQENIENINELLKLSPYLQNIQVIQITSLEDRDSFYPIWVNLAKTNKLPNLVDLNISKVKLQHLKILLVQENKPKLDLSKLIYENGDIVDDECLQILSSQPNLLNMEIFDLSQLRIIQNGISSSTLLEFALSKYVCNIKKIILYEDQEKVKRATLPKLEDKLQKKLNKLKKIYEIYEQNGEEMNVSKEEVASHQGEYAGIYEDMLLTNNFSSLESVEFKRVECIHPLYVLYTAHRVKKRFYSPKFNLEDFFVHLANIFLDDTLDSEQIEKKQRIRLIYNLFYEVDKSFYTKRHKVLKMAPFQVFTSSLYSFMDKIENVSLIQEINVKLTQSSYSFLYFLRYSYMKKRLFLNLRKVNVDTDYSQTYYFELGYFTSALRSLEQSIVDDIFQFSPFFYKTVISMRRDSDYTIEQIFSYLNQYPQVIGNMKDLVFYLEEIEAQTINQIFQSVKEFKCKQLVLKRHSNNLESKEQSFVKTQQDIILNNILTKKTIKNIKRFKPFLQITFKQFIELLNIDFFHSSVNIFEFYKNHVEQSEQTKPKFSEVLQLKKFKNYYQLEELVIPNFDLDIVNNNECELSQFQINKMNNLKELKIQYSVSQADLEYLCCQVYPFNSKLKITLNTIQDEVLISIFTPPKLEEQQKPSNTKQNIAENEDKEQSINYQECKQMLLQMTSYTYDQKGFDWTYFIKLINQHLNQLDEQKKMAIYQNINQNSSRYYLPKLQISPSILFNKELGKLTVNKLYYPYIQINDPKYTSSIQLFISKLDCIQNVSIQGEGDYNFFHLLPLFEKCYSTQLFEDIFEHSSSQITFEDTAKIPEYIFFNMNYLCLKKNKFILNEKTIEVIQYQKKRFFLDDAGGQKKNKKKKQQKKGSNTEIEQQQNQNNEQEENHDENQAQNELKEKNESSSGSDSDSDSNQSQDGKENAAIKAEKEVEEEEEQRINDEDLMDQKKWFTKETLAQFIQKFEKLKRINFGDTQIAGEHFNSISFNNLHYKLEHIDLDNCKVQNPTVFLTNFLQAWESNKEDGEPRLQLQRFISQISFTNNYPSNIEFIKELIESKYFKEHVKYLNLINLIKLHEQNGKELMKILSHILKRGDNMFCITSFLITLGDIRNKIGDAEFDLIARSYNQIQYLSPFLFNNVYQGFNHIIQHTSVSPKSKVMYFLSTNFQKYISGCSFYEILYLIFDEDDLIRNQIIFESFYDIVEDEFYKLQDLFDTILKLLDSFSENQIGVNMYFFDQISYYIHQLPEIMNQQQQVMGELINIQKKIIATFNILGNKYCGIAALYQQALDLKKSQSEAGGTKSKSSNRIKTQQNRLSVLASSQTQSFLQKSANQNLKNLQERGIIEKKLHQYEHQVIITLQYIIYMCQKMKKTFDYNELWVLLEFVETLNLRNNSFLNFKGFNNYIKSHVSPWLAMNQGIQKLKETGYTHQKLDLSTKNMKILVQQSKQEQEEEINDTKRNNLENLIESDNELDDTIFDHLCLFIQKRMKGLRYLNLSGVNISDIFAEKFSLILSDEEQLRNLVKLDLTNNKRLSAFGMKYLYAAIVDRIHKGFRFELSSTFAEVQSLKSRVTSLEKKIENLDDKKEETKDVEQKGKILKSEEDKLISPNKMTNEQKNKQSKDKQIQIEKTNISKEKEQKQDNLQLEAQTISAPNEVSSIFQKYLSQSVSKKDRALKKLFDEYERFQEYLKKCSEQVDKYDSVGEQVDLSNFLNNVTNIGLFDSINSFVLRNWKTHYYLIILIGIILFPLTIFHLIQVMTIRINTTISTYTFSPDFIHRIFKKKNYYILVDKKVPESITSEDFYFDKDVAILDQVISGKNININDSGQKAKLKRIEQFLENPTQDSFQNIKKGTQTEKVFNLIRYFHYVIYFNMIVFQIFLSVIYPFIIENEKSQDNCQTTSVTQDIPIYIYLVISAFIEITLLKNLEQIIGSQQIFTTSSLSIISLVTSSIMAKYDIYTDVCFGMLITKCDKLKSQDLGAYCLALASLNILISLVTQRNAIVRIWDFRRKKPGEIHNTAFINQYTKLALVQEMNAFGSVLDRFSTTSVQKSLIKINFLQGILVPQVIVSKFTRAFIENIPQIAILLLYQFRQEGESQIKFGSWQYLRVILSSLLSLISALSQAWHAKPSVFKTYMFTEYLSFIQKGQSGYKINITYKDFSQSYSYEQIYAKIKAYLRIYPIVRQSDKDNNKRLVISQLQRQQSQSQAQNESASQIQDNLSQDQSVNITSNHTLRSVQQSEAVSTQRRPSVTSQKMNNDDQLSENSGIIRQYIKRERKLDYKQGLIQYLATDGLTPEEFWKCVDYVEDQENKELQIQKLKAESKTKIPQIK
ncbi:hypothetical protein ABPG74_016024 [Tetrahymena malaccensis]